MSTATSEKDALTQRIDDLLALAAKLRAGSSTNLTELYQRTLTLMVAVYGGESHQVTDWRASIGKVSGYTPMHDRLLYFEGALSALKADIEAGLVGDLQKRLTGEILSDFLQLARTAFDSGAKDVAAVLTAALYEDTIRRLGTDLAGIVERDKLSDVLAALKKKEILQGTQFGIAQSYLQFRNAALHADWKKIEQSSIESALGFVQGLLLKHYS
jgi:hypothetical protein